MIRSMFIIYASNHTTDNVITIATIISTVVSLLPHGFYWFQIMPLLSDLINYTVVKNMSSFRNVTVFV